LPSLFVQEAQDTRRAPEAGFAGRLAVRRRATRLPARLVRLLVRQVDAAELGDLQGRVAQRAGRAVERLHPVHEVEHVAGVVAGEAVEDARGEVDRAARVLVRVEGAQDLDLVALAYGLQAVVGEDGAEVRACADVREVDSSVVCWHGATTTIS
jgi:hypothetical protein